MKGRPGKEGEGEEGDEESQLPGSDPAFRLAPFSKRLCLFLCFCLVLVNLYFQ